MPPELHVVRIALVGRKGIFAFKKNGDKLTRFAVFSAVPFTFAPQSVTNHYSQK
ncbi:MAG: hypothetical protein HY842_18970 [Bacteroidetes bacterium]|nr:hypothetical protein [Bacteroidota bacterium]